MKKLFIIFILILSLLIGCSANEESGVELTISAAASLTESLNELNEVYKKEYPNIRITYNYGGSGSLRKQIEQGAPIDLFLSASSIDYERLVEQGLVEKGTAFLTNNLVLITREENEVESLEKFMNGENMMAIGTPETVPVGSYAKEALHNLENWKKLEGQSRLIFTKDVTQVLTLVKEGAVEVGIVYESDVLHEQDVKIIHQFDPALHTPIHYYIAMMDHLDHDKSIVEAKETYFEFISSEVAMETFKKNGFRSIE